MSLKPDSLSVIIPSMRPGKVLAVLHDIAKQTKAPDKVIVVDNGCNFKEDKAPFDKLNLEIIYPGENIGTNAVWNMVFDFDTDYVGFVGDDLRLDPNMFHKLIAAFHFPYTKGRIGPVKVGATVPMIINKMPLPKSDPKNMNGEVLKSGKGLSGVVVIRRSVLNLMPRIPKELRVFFGDDWLSMWSMFRGYYWIMLHDCYIYHKFRRNRLGKRLGYKRILRQERHHWDKFKEDFWNGRYNAELVSQ